MIKLKNKTLIIKKILILSLGCLLLVFSFFLFQKIIQPHMELSQASKTALSDYQKAQNNNALSNEAKIKSTLDAYFKLHYESQKWLKKQDFSMLIEDNTLDWVKTEKGIMDLEIYIDSKFRTAYSSYSYTLDYDSITITNDTAIVKLRESNEIHMDEYSSPSKMGNLPHTFTLLNKHGEWKIFTDEYANENTQLLRAVPLVEIKKTVDANYHLMNQGN